MKDQIKLVAVDMDGTFLNKKHTYDRARFLKIYTRMKAQGARFVVASGNQYAQLRSFFEPIADDLVFISENGGLIMDGGHKLFCADLPEDKIRKALAILKQHPEFLTVISCEKQAYMLDTAPEFFVNIMRVYFHRLQLVKSYEDIQGDPYLKISISVPEAETMDWVEVFKASMEGTLEVTSSGHGCIDLIGKGLHKGQALSRLMTAWGIDAGACMAFGDGYNDIEMLKLCRYGYVMANAPEDMLAEFELHAPSNEADGVLEVLEQWF